MRDVLQGAVSETAARARMVAAMLIAGFWPGRSAPEIADRLEAEPAPVQVGVIGGVLGLMFLLSLFAAQFGLLGIALFLGAVVVVVA